MDTLHLDEETEERRILTPRLVLRSPAERDVERLVALADNPKIAFKLASVPHPYRAQDARDFIARARSGTPATGMSFAVALRETGEPLIGACGYGPFGDAGDMHLIYWIGEPYWGRGFATEAAHAVVDFAFGAGRLDQLWSASRVTNPAARRVIEKCGFQYRENGLIRSAAVGGMVPVEFYRLDRRTWASLKAWAAQ